MLKYEFGVEVYEYYKYTDKCTYMKSYRHLHAQRKAEWI